MGSSYGEIRLDDITQEQIEQFYRFLKGEVPTGLYMKCSPKLSSRNAFRVIYYLQEVLCVLPDKFERCKTCGDIFDSEDAVGKGLHCEAHSYLD